MGAAYYLIEGEDDVLETVQNHGIRSLEDLKTIETEDLVQLGLRRELANQIRAYVSEVGHRLPRL
jgi:hypothetical protein